MYIIGTNLFLGQHIPDHSMFRLYGATHTSTMEPQICNFLLYIGDLHLDDGVPHTV